MAVTAVMADVAATVEVAGYAIGIAASPGTLTQSGNTFQVGESGAGGNGGVAGNGARAEDGEKGVKTDVYIISEEEAGAF